MISKNFAIGPSLCNEMPLAFGGPLWLFVYLKARLKGAPSCVLKSGTLLRVYS